MFSHQEKQHIKDTMHEQGIVSARILGYPSKHVAYDLPSVPKKRVSGLGTLLNDRLALPSKM